MDQMEQIILVAEVAEVLITPHHGTLAVVVVPA
jgi:hypothetical protein